MENQSVPAAHLPRKHSNGPGEGLKIDWLIHRAGIDLFTMEKYKFSLIFHGYCTIFGDCCQAAGRRQNAQEAKTK